MKRFVLTLFFFLCVSLVAAGLFLKKGIYLESFSAGPATLSKISLQWQDKLELEIESLAIVRTLKESGKQAPDFGLIGKAVPLIQWIDRLFAKISIQTITVGEMSGKLLYESSLCSLSLSSQLLDLEATIRLAGDVLRADINNLSSEQLSSKASGDLWFDLKMKSGGGQFSANIADSLPVTIELSADTKQLSFQGKEAGAITTITPFVDLFGLDPSIQEWITDYLTGSRYHLRSFTGNFPWKDPLALLDTFLAEVRVDDCEYTFAPGLEAIQSEYTDVAFKKGVLVISPHNSTFYGQNGGDSWLDINCKDPDNILLTAHILTHAKVNQDIVNLLDYYGIALPFIQTEGETNTDLILSVNLNSGLLRAQGVFLIDEGLVAHGQENYAVHDSRILLEDSRVTLEKLHVRLGQLFAADIVGSIAGDTATTDLDITLQEFALAIGELQLILDGSEKKPTLHYTMRPEGGSISAEASSWKIGALPLRLGPFSTPFLLDTMSGKIAPTTLSCPPFLSAEVSGSFSLKEQLVDLQWSLLQFHGRNVRLEKGPQLLTVQYDKGLTIRSTTESQWLLNTVPATLSPTDFTFFDTTYSIGSSRIRYGTFFDSTVSGSYDLFTHQGRFLLKDLDIQKDTIGHFLTPMDTLSVEVDGREDIIRIKVPELDMELSSDAKKSWMLLFEDLETVYDHSPFLQRYLVDEGSLTIGSQDEAGYAFSADIPYSYSLLVKDGIPVSRYQIDGVLDDKGFYASLNKDIEIVYDDGLRATAQDISLNIPAVIQLFKDLPGYEATDSVDKNELRYTLEASNTNFVFSPERRILADEILLESIAGKTTLQLQYGEGSMFLDVEGEAFSLAGEGLNDVFMNGLWSGAKFETGTMSVAAKGTFDDFTAMVKIEDTLLRDFKVLNNVLALVNTLPALITFSLPSYSSKGLPVGSVIAGMTVKDRLATVNSLDLESPEISIKGNGWIDFPKKKIAMDLNLITQAKKNINKIPLVGYVLVGKEKRPSITVQVSGDLFDPNVEYSAYREVATEPFYMLYRTLALPFHLVAPVFGLDEEVPQEKLKDGVKGVGSQSGDNWSE